MTPLTRTSLFAALAVVGAYGGMLWWASVALDRHARTSPQLESLTGATDTPFMSGPDPLLIFGLILTVSMATLLIVFLSLLRYAMIRPDTTESPSESLRSVAGTLAAQQAKLETLTQRLDSLSVGRLPVDDATTRHTSGTAPEIPRGRPSSPAPLSLTKLPHVLRTPLHGVIGHVQNLRRDAATLPVHLDALDAIERSGRHLLDLLNDLVDLSRLEAGESSLAHQPMSLQQVVDDALTEVGDFAAQRGVALQPEPVPPLPWTEGDNRRLRRLLVRLIRSAVGCHSATNDDSALRLEIRHENERLTVSLIGNRHPGGFAAVGATEDGSDALTETDLDYLIGSRMVTLSGGDVLRDVSSGAFSARLPFVSREALTTEREETEASLSDIHCRLMIVEPRPELKAVCDRVLRGPQCTVVAEQDLASARRRLQRDPFDLVLFGIEGPAKSTEDAAAELRLVAAGDPALITVRQSSDPAPISSADNAGFDAVLDRPLDPGELLTTVGKLLARPQPETRAEASDTQAGAWPQPLGKDTAARINAAIELGDIDDLVILCVELSDTEGAPAADIELMKRAVQLFDLDVLERVAARCAGAAPESASDT